MATDDLRFRAATTADLDRVLEIHVTAFPDARGGEERRRAFTASPFGALDDLVLALQGDEIVGQAFLFPLQAWFGGRSVPIGGVASLAVAPEARGRGVATALLGALLVAADMRGDALTMLYAFRQRFYTRVGYGPSVSGRRLGIDPGSVPASWLALAKARVRRARGEDKEAILAAYARSAAKASGWLTRSAAAWDRHLAKERRQFLVAERPAREGGGVAGYVAFEVLQDEPHAATTVQVDEIAADDDVTRLALVGALAAMRDQIREIELQVDGADPLELGLVDPDARRFGTSRIEHDLGTIVGGPMVRIEDVPRAIEARGYRTEGSFDVVVHAGAGETNGAGDELAVSVRVADGHAEVSAARGAAGAIRTTRSTLASLLYGGLKASDAVRLGLADADARTLARADAILALPPPMPVDPF
ncbi:enhanced intracellular survival protein Eis [soil metagenome]